MDENVSGYMQRLSKLKKPDRSALKRHIGTAIREADVNSLAAFYRCMPFGIPSWQEERYYAIGCLYFLWREQSDSLTELPVVIRQMLDEGQLSDSYLRRIELLLSTPWDEDCLLLGKLTSLLRMIRSQNSVCEIDFAALLTDLLRWNGPSRSVQKKWAKEIFGGLIEQDEEAEEAFEE